jgi:hypothetical protein
VKPDGLSAKLRWKSYSFCHVDSLLEHPLCPNSGCQRKRVNSTSDNVSRMPFWLATFDQVEVNALDQGFISMKPLEPVWVNEASKPFPSPLLP